MKDKIYIWGKNPVLELLRAKSRPAEKVYVQNSRAKEYAKLLSPLGIKFQKLDKGKMHNLIDRPDHQGIIAETVEYNYADFLQIADIPAGFIVLAEGITDPQNLGAMIRSCYLLGAKGLIIPEKYSASITNIVTHTSAGATEYLAIARVESIANAINELKRRNFDILASLPSGKDVHDIREVELSDKIALLMGSEGEGIKKSTQKCCDRFITIPQAGQLDSFSVSAATAVLAYQIADKMGII
ncbi:MAG: 23S rRNA (guanosine(2251)-2'-O)-methyltransferase RlmB [Candidatus Zixiibacteriota bacterium]